MKKFWFNSWFTVLFFVLILSTSLLLTGHQAADTEKEQQKTEDKEKKDIQVPPPPLNEDTFPCSMCHADMETNLKRRELVDFHDDIILKHDEKNRWCMACHDTENRDMLHSASGELIDFTESYKLCGQCHGPKLRDWEAGIHGRRIGEWNGEKQYLLCAHCHDPHSPKFQKMKPEPAPIKPGKKK